MSGDRAPSYPRGKGTIEIPVLALGVSIATRTDRNVGALASEREEGVIGTEVSAASHS